MSRVAVTGSFPPDDIVVMVKPRGREPVRLAADEPRIEDTFSGFEKSGEMPGGHKESSFDLGRERQSPADLPVYSDATVHQGGEEIWAGRIDKPSEPDGDGAKVSLVGHRKALEDDKNVIGLGFITGKLDRWQEASPQRKVDILNEGALLNVETSTGRSGKADAETDAGLIFKFTDAVDGKTEVGELWLDGEGVELGEVRFDPKALEGQGMDADFQDIVGLSLDDVASLVDESLDFNQGSSTERSVLAGGPGRKHAFARCAYTNTTPTVATFPANTYGYLNPKVIANHGLVPIGDWPHIGFTAKQMIEYGVPRHTYLTVDPDNEDDGYVIEEAWYPDTTMLAFLEEVSKFGGLDWFVFDDKVLRRRFPGTYGREWVVPYSEADLREDGEDGDRLWRTIMGRFTDTDGSTRTVGAPGSGADVEDPRLEVTDPDHPAVLADITRNDVLNFRGLSTFARSIEACIEFLQKGNELSSAGSCSLTGYVLDSTGIWRPAGQVQPGDRVRVVGARDSSPRKITAPAYGHEARRAACSVGAPPDGLQALLERMQADIESLALATA